MNQPTLKTKGMQRLEFRLGVPLEKYIADRYAKGATQSAIAGELHVTTGTISKWMAQFGIEAQYGPKGKAA